MMFAGAERPLRRLEPDAGDYHIRPWLVRGGTNRGTEGSVMLRATAYQNQAIAWDTMTTRTAALVTIALLAVLLAFVALAALFAGDISERAGAIVTTVLGSFATVLAGLLLFLRVETINAKVDDAASHASVAAQRASVVEQKVDTVHHDMLNGGMRENIKKAYEEIEDDPVILARRIELAALGVQKDRHALKNRRAAERMRAQLEQGRGMPRRDDEAGQ